MIRTYGNKSSCEWVAIRVEFDQLQVNLRRLDPTFRRRLLLDFVRPDDHFLPLKVLRYSLEQIAVCSFDELRNTPGVGAIKIRNLLDLFQRILRQSTGEEPAPSAAAPQDFFHRPLAAETSPDAPHDEAAITEFEWAAWRAKVRQHGLDQEAIGRLVYCLADLPRSVWHTTLGFYCDLTLEQLRELKSYGARRVAAIIDTFRRLNAALHSVESCPGTALVLGPEAVAAADAWIVDVLLQRVELTPVALQERLLKPLLLQIDFDLGHVAAGVSAERVGAHFPAAAGVITSDANLTWAERLSYSRQHQIRQDVGAMIRVRWPRGADLCARLVDMADRLSPERGLTSTAEALAMFFPHLKNPRTVEHPVSAN